MPRQGSRVQHPLTSHASPPRPRRSTASSHATVTRGTTESPNDARQSLRLTVKMPSSKLREAISARDISTNSEDVGEKRSTRNKPRKSYVMESESDEEDEVAGDEDEDEAEVSDMDEDDRPGLSFNRADVDDSDDDQDIEDEGEEDAEGDIDMDDDADDGLPLGAPPPGLPTIPSLKIKGPAAPQQQPKVTVTPAQDTKLKSVEAKETEMEDDDEELSELGSDDEEDEDAEGEDEVDEMEEGDESHSPEAGSRASTPDVSKMTKRQRSRFDQVMGGDFLQLPMGKYPNFSLNSPFPKSVMFAFNFLKALLFLLLLVFRSPSSAILKSHLNFHTPHHPPPYTPQPSLKLQKTRKQS